MHIEQPTGRPRKRHHLIDIFLKAKVKKGPGRIRYYRIPGKKFITYDWVCEPGIVHTPSIARYYRPAQRAPHPYDALMENNNND